MTNPPVSGVPTDPFGRLVHEVAHPPFHSVLGLEAVRYQPDDGTVFIRLPGDPQLGRSRQQAFFHGGVLAAMADIAAHAAIAVQVGHPVPTVDLRMDYLRPAPLGELMAEATPLQVGRSIGRADVRIRTVGETPVLVAVARATFSTLASNALGKE